MFILYYCIKETFQDEKGTIISIDFDQLYANCKGYKDDIVNLFTLFFADDGLIIAQNKENAIKNIKYVNECGLKINRNKSKVLIYNNAQEIEEIEGLKITSEIKYLGIHIINKKKCFKKTYRRKFKKRE